jgi:hypothetical protein
MDIQISRAGSGLPSRVVLYGVEGVGKTSFAAFAPNPLFVMTRAETGLLTLIDNGRVPERDHFNEADTWAGLLKQLEHVLKADLPHKTLVVDVLGGAARLCEEHVCRQSFGGDPLGYAAYGKGPEVALAEWQRLFTALDMIRERKRMLVVALAHAVIKPFKNPEGDDYDRYVPEMHEKLWRVAAKWADVILFSNFETFVKKEQSKAKGKASGRRLLYTQRTAAWDAKNRVGLPEQIDMGDAPGDAFPAFAAAMKEARAAQRAANTPPAPQPADNPAPVAA